jgi:hypothetical protein
MAGEPEDDPDEDGGGSGPCCWPYTGIVNTESALARRKIDAQEQRNNERANFAMLIMFE